MMQKQDRKRSFPKDKFIDFISTLREAKDSLIIVEGIKDKKALEFWQITTPIAILKRPFFSFVEEIATKYSKKTTIILLLDRDKEGEKMHNKLKTEFRNYGFRTNSSFWMKLSRFYLTYVEGLNNSFFQQLKSDLQNEIFGVKQE
ncbi:MAG: hypothetical protein ACTSQE_00360 [Candidatus Heimdallarchaeaceae archaeon]